MKKTFFIYALALAGLTATTGLTSCSDFLDADNKSNVTIEEYYKTEAGFESLVNATYSSLRAIYGGKPALFCNGTDLYGNGRNAMDNSLHGYRLDANNGDVKTFYQNCYAGIQLANTVIYYSDKTKQTDKIAQRVDEVRFIRAFFYYLLSQQFGGVPLENDYIQSAKNNFPRKSLSDTYAYIIGELTDLDENGHLPENYAADEGRANKQAVRSVLAHAYLAAGWDLDVSANEDGSNPVVNDKKYFELAARMADKAIGGKRLTMSFADKWAPGNDGNEEVIFAVQYERTAAETAFQGNAQQNYFGSYYGADSDGNKYCVSSYSPMLKLMMLFQPGDERYKSTFIPMILHYDKNMPANESGYYGYYKSHKDELDVDYYYPAWYESSAEDIAAWRAEDPEHRTNTRVVPMTDPTFSSEVKDHDVEISYKEAIQKICGITCISKFDDPDAAISGTSTETSYRDVVVAHLSETYLVAAEAYYMADDKGSALARINEVRNRAKAASLQEDDLSIDKLLDERALELAGEYYRWMDLRRTKKLVEYNLNGGNEQVRDINDMRGTDGKIKWYRPIPQDEINLNEAMTEADQNDGYK